MDPHSLDVLEYPELKAVLRRYATSGLAGAVIDALQPSSDPERLRMSLRQVDEARALHDRGRAIPARGLRDMVQVVEGGHRHSRPLEPAELLLIRDTLAAIEVLAEFFLEVREEAPTLAALAAGLGDHRDLRLAIERVADERTGVKDDATPRLWELRRGRRALEEQIRELMNSLVRSRRLRPFLQDNTWSLRGDRYVLPVKFDKRGYVPGILHDKSSSGESAFVEPTEVAALANALKDVRVDEDREVSRVLLELSRLVYQEQGRLTHTQGVAAWLDFTATRAAMSAELGLVPGILAADGVIRLRQARHPLLLAARHRGTLEHDVVPMNLTLGESFRMLVVTGPNTGGKTVALKTLGLVQLMFQSGLHVPAAPGSELPCLDAVFADIGDEQSISQNLSTFSGHVRNISRILGAASERSLVLLDELGAGTDPAEGAALGQATLDYLRGVGPLCAVTTHIGVLKAYAFARADVENACVAFDPETLSPTYELLVGQPGSSNALIIARRHGMPGEIIDLAADLAEGKRGRAEELMDALMHSRVAAERSRQASQELEARSRERLEEAEAVRGEATDARDRAEREAEHEVADIIGRFADAARPHLNALKNVPRSLLSHVEEIESLLRGKMRMTPFSDRRRSFLKDLKRHDRVFVPRYGQVCRVEKMNRGDERLTVRMGSLSVEIGFDDISWVTPPDAEG